jgi:hypothetical protein
MTKLYVIEYCPPKGQPEPLKSASGQIYYTYTQQKKIRAALKSMRTVTPMANYKIATYQRVEK